MKGLGYKETKPRNEMNHAVREAGGGFTDSEGPDQAAHSHSLNRVFAFRLQSSKIC